MAREIHRLSHRTVQAATKPGRFADGGGLYLDVTPAGGKKWTFLYRSPTRRVSKPDKATGTLRTTGKLREMGLGSVQHVPLAKARNRAADARALLALGKDPLDERVEAEVEPARVPTFGEVADQVVASLESGWRNDKHRAQWKSTLSTYCAPIRSKPVDKIEVADVLAILSPIWTTKAETASRLRGRIEKVLDAATAKGHRSGTNPAAWKGNLAHLLPKRQKLQRGHHPAMPWSDLPAFVARLREMGSVGARALEFVILTAARSGEVLRSVRGGRVHGMRWEEIDRGARVWTVPGDRMKAGKAHRVPLTARALAILDEVGSMERGAFVFPGQRRATPLSEMALEAILRRLDAKPYTVHGFRSTFREWAGDCTGFPREIAEAALSHAVGDAVERAYRRGDALERRRELMEAWARFCEPSKTGNVLPLIRASGGR
jgi:integrase